MPNNAITQRMFRVLVAVSLFAATFMFAQPASAQEIAPNPVAEQYLLEQLRATGYIDLEWEFAEEDRGVRGEIILQALRDPDVLSQPLIYIANTTVTDDLWADDLVISANIYMSKMEFNGYVGFSNAQLQSLAIYDSNFLGEKISFQGASFSRDLILANNTIGGTVNFDIASIDGYTAITENTINGNLSFTRAALNGNVDLRNNTISESLCLYGAQIAGELVLIESKVLGTQSTPDSFPTDLRNTIVDRVAYISNVEFKGEASFIGSHFGRLDMNGSTFSSPVSFSEAMVDQIADFDSVHFMSNADFTNFSTGSDANFRSASFDGAAVFENVSVGRDGNFQDATFNGIADFDYFTAERFVDFSGTTFNQDFEFYYTEVAYPYFDNTVFNGPVTFEGMQASQAFEIIDSTYNSKEPFTAFLIDVTGPVNFKGITVPAGLLLSGSHFESLTISTNGVGEIASIDLTGTAIDGDLLIQDVSMARFLAEGSSVGRSTTLKRVSIKQELDLRNASIGFLKVDDNLEWPKDPQAFNLRGMTYSDIDLGDQGLTEETWKGLLQLVNQSAYSPQSYQALSQFLVDKGHPDWASEVQLAQRGRERSEILTPLSGSWFWSWFLFIFAGYGHRPVFAIFWSVLVIATGAFVFRRKEYMLPVEQDDVQVEYNPIWYSFSLFLPYIDLGIASKWEPNPERKWARNYKYFHMMMGWVLAPIALLTFGGIIG